MFTTTYKHIASYQAELRETKKSIYLYLKFKPRKTKATTTQSCTEQKRRWIKYLNAASVSSHTITMIRNLFHSHAVTRFASSAHGRCTSTRWSSALMTRFPTIFRQRIYQSIIRCWQLFPWVYRTRRRPVTKEWTKTSHRPTPSSTARSIHRRRSSSSVKIVRSCFALNVSLNTQKWSMMWSRFRQK